MSGLYDGLAVVLLLSLLILVLMTCWGLYSLIERLLLARREWSRRLAWRKMRRNLDRATP